jgi:hypothetical protein
MRTLTGVLIAAVFMAIGYGLVDVVGWHGSTYFYCGVVYTIVIDAMPIMQG